MCKYTGPMRTQLQLRTRGLHVRERRAAAPGRAVVQRASVRMAAVAFWPGTRMLAVLLLEVRLLAAQCSALVKYDFRLCAAM